MLNQLTNLSLLIQYVANIEAATLDIKELLDHLPEPPASVGDELQQIAELSRTVARKLEIDQEVNVIRNLQESRVQANKMMRDSYTEAAESLKAMCDCKDCKPDGEDGTA